MDSMRRRALLEEILREGAVFPVFQPIVELSSGRIVGVEALARGPADSPLRNPDALFPAAIEAGLLHELDTLCAARSLQTARRHQGELPPLLFVNSDPGAFTRPPTPELRAAINDPGPYRVVLEFTERALATNPTGLLDVARSVHQAGNALALDDVGAEPLSLAFLPLIEPETVKLDMQLLRDPYSAHTITTAAGVAAFAERTGASVLAEGIETDQDLLRAVALGATWGQGWLFGRPGPLDALAGRPINPNARLRQSQPGLHRPAGTAFTTAAARCPARLADIRTAAAFAEHLLRDATLAGRYGVLLAGDDDPAGFTTWLSRFPAVAPLLGFAGMISPADNSGVPAGIRHASAEPAHPGRPEAALVMVTPDKVAALCIRYRPTPGDVDLILTHDPATVLELARMLLGQLGTDLSIRQAAPEPVDTLAG